MASRRFLALALVALELAQPVLSIHHMKLTPPKLSKRQGQSNSDVPLHVLNSCADTVYPGITTQNGDHGPESTGFRLGSGDERTLHVANNWQGRVWGRTNCSFNDQGNGPAGGGGGRACTTGDCNGLLNCMVTGDNPTTLAEFTLNAGDGQTYFDISVVDGYNLPMAIVTLTNTTNNAADDSIPANLTTPACIGTSSLLAGSDFNPYNNNQQFLGTNSSFPLPLNTKVSSSDVARWCPWDLQVSPPDKPGDGVYPYPDDNIQRPPFNPCLSACAKYNKPQDCCTGSYGSPSSCSPSSYSKSAKNVCPDAYSYAFDDQTSTFVIPTGPGFSVIFCPFGKSTNILATGGDQLTQLTQRTISRRNHLAAREAALAAQEESAVVEKRNEASVLSLESGRLRWTLAFITLTAAYFISL